MVDQLPGLAARLETAHHKRTEKKKTVWGFLCPRNEKTHPMVSIKCRERLVSTILERYSIVALETTAGIRIRKRQLSFTREGQSGTTLDE